MKHNKHQTCWCRAVKTKDGKKFPHRFDFKRCTPYEDEEGDGEYGRTAEDNRLDDPIHGQADADNRMEAIYRGRWER